MKKLFALLLAAIFSLSALSVCAEEIDLDGIETSVPAAKDTAVLAPELRVEELATSTDVVEVTDSRISIVTAGVNITFDIATAGGGYVCLTQDIFASMADYMMMSDPYATQEELINQGVNLFAIDLYTNGGYYVFTAGSDELTNIVRNLADLSGGNLEKVASMITTNPVTETYNGNIWIHESNDHTAYLTIVNNQYVMVQFDSDVVAEDIPFFLEALTVTAA